MQNIIEMSIVMGIHKKVNRHIFERMSLIYYYRGNSIMSLQCLEKAEIGLSQFEREIYNREYNKKEELSRLETKLFTNEQIHPSLKRKNNPRFEEDVNRNSFIEYHEKSPTIYLDCINSMMKNHGSSKAGRFIKEVFRKNKSIGNIQSFKESSHQRTKLNEYTIDNSTRVIKTHLSNNRDNIKINTEQRWKKFIIFIKDLYCIVNGARFGKSRRMGRMIRWS